jgi:inosine/xanthosine triphosphatase
VFDAGFEGISKSNYATISRTDFSKRETMKHLFVGSTNPAKLEAVRLAVVQHWPEVKIEGFNVKSNVSEQPMSDTETQTGAINRAKAALAAGLASGQKIPSNECLGIGLEGGVTKIGDELWATVWVAVTDQDGNVFSANGARIKISEFIAGPILAGGEMGPVVSKLVGIEDVRTKQGMIGVVTSNFVTRAEEYGNIAKLAIGLWYGREWDLPLR